MRLQKIKGLNTIIKRYLNDLREKADDSKSEMERKFYMNRYDVYLKEIAEFAQMSERELKLKIGL